MSASSAGPFLTIATGLWLACVVGGDSSGPLMEQTDVFQQDARDTYRIPSIVVSKAGVVLAFASRRRGSAADFGHESDVVLRRSLDGGRTWQAMQTLASRDTIDIHHGPAVVDRDMGAILKFCRFWPAEGNPQQVVRTTPYTEMKRLAYVDHVLRSDDDGATWTGPQPLHLPFPHGAVNAATGNGNHGIQLADGRLLIQGGYSLERDAPDRRHSCVYYSDDGGASWRLGASASAGGSIREFGMAETADGQVYLNLRNNTGNRRIVAHSTDGGLTLGELRLDDALPEPRCHAGLVRLRHEGSDLLIFSNPAIPHDGETGQSYRKELTVRASPDGGRTWPIARLIHRGPSAYSDLAVTENGTILCLYERGENHPYEKIACAWLNLEWLTGR
jgi:sialidase-1